MGCLRIHEAAIVSPGVGNDEAWRSAPLSLLSMTFSALTQGATLWPLLLPRRWPAIPR
jgi:hypothetical protein